MHCVIGILAVIMLASMKFHVQKIFTGLTGIACIVASLWSSVRYNRMDKLPQA